MSFFGIFGIFGIFGPFFAQKAEASMNLMFIMLLVGQIKTQPCLLTWQYKSCLRAQGTRTCMF